MNRQKSAARRSRRPLVAAVVIVGAALTGCAASGPSIRTDYDRSADFSAYRTYAYVQPVGTDRAGYSTLTTQHFKNAIDSQLGERGFRKVESGADLLVNFNANASEKVDVRAAPTATVGVGYYHYRYGLYTGFPLYRNDVETVRYKVGTANVDVVDAKRQQLVWEGIAEGRLTKEVMRNPEPAIRAAVAEMFRTFPGRASAAQ